MMQNQIETTENREIPVSVQAAFRSIVPFEELKKSFNQIQKQYSEALYRFQFNIAGHPISVNILGQETARTIDLAFNHLKTSNYVTPELSINLWEKQTSDMAFSIQQYREYSDPDIVLMASQNGRFIGEVRDQSINVLDRLGHEIYAYTTSANQRYLDELAKPLNKLLSTWLYDRGQQFIHAGLVSIKGQGVLFVGSGGAGKSTSSIACLNAGIRYLGDDVICLETNKDNTYTGHSMFATCLLNVDHLKRFPNLLPYAESASRTHENKSVLYLANAFPQSLLPSTKISVLVLPRVVDANKTSFRPASKVETLLALGPSSVMFLSHPNARAFARLAELVEHVPSYWLELGRDVNQIPQVVRQLVTQVST